MDEALTRADRPAVLAAVSRVAPELAAAVVDAFVTRMEDDYLLRHSPEDPE
jgi:hypothetical protein